MRWGVLERVSKSSSGSAFRADLEGEHVTGLVRGHFLGEARS